MDGSKWAGSLFTVDTSARKVPEKSSNGTAGRGSVEIASDGAEGMVSVSSECQGETIGLVGERRRRFLLRKMAKKKQNRYSDRIRGCETR